MSPLDLSRVGLVKFKIRYRHSTRGRKPWLVYFGVTFVRSFHSKAEAEAFIESKMKKNPKRKTVTLNTRRLSNPRRVDLPMLYGRVLRVEAQKTQAHVCDSGCKRASHCYYHNFKNGVAEYGLPAGARLLLPSGVSFTLPERSLLLTRRIR